MPQTEITVQVKNTLSDVFSILKSKGYSEVETFTLFYEYFSRFSLEEIETTSYKELIGNSLLLRKIECKTTET